MGRRSHPETLAAIYQAFLRQRTWKQAELAEHIGIQPPALRKWLEELARAGLPLERDEERPHVFWSIRPDWFPGGVVLTAGEATELVRQLFRLARSTARDRLIRRALGAHADGDGHSDRQRAVVAPEVTDTEQASLSTVEDSVLKRRPLALRYFSAARGTSEPRSLSVQRVVPGPPARFIAVCHRDGALKWFRIERTSAVRSNVTEVYRDADAARVEALLRESVDGYHGGGEAVLCSFVVTGAEARWVPDNLPASMQMEPIDGGVRLTTTTAAVLPLARFVVGLGEAATVETRELKAKVAELARGALSRTQA